MNMNITIKNITIKKNNNTLLMSKFVLNNHFRSALEKPKL